MSRLVANLHLYDSYDSIRCVVRVHDFDHAHGPDRIVLEAAEKIEGRGLSDPNEWLQHALGTLLRRMDV